MLVMQCLAIAFMSSMVVGAVEASCEDADFEALPVIATNLLQTGLEHLPVSRGEGRALFDKESEPPIGTRLNLAQQALASNRIAKLHVQERQPYVAAAGSALYTIWAQVPINNLLRDYLPVSLVAFNLFTWINGREKATEQQPASGRKPRVIAWDIIKLFVMTTIVAGHVQIYHYWPGYADDNLFGKFNAYPVSFYAMGVFLFMSGIMSYSPSFGALGRTLCCTIGCDLMIQILSPKVIGSGIAGVANYFSLLVHGQAGGMWFLWSLAFCRLFVAPFVHIARHFDLSVAIPILVVMLASNLLLHLFGKDNLSTFLGGDSSSHLMMPFYELSLYFAPVFAAGMWFRSEEWVQIFSRVSSVVLACFCVSVCSMTYYSSGNDWMEFSCKNSSCTHLNKIPSSFFLPLTARSFARTFMLQVGMQVMTLASVCLWFRIATVFERAMPTLSAYIASWGSRTLYVYALHEQGLKIIARAMILVPLWCQRVLHYPAIALIVIVLGSEGTRRLLHWIVEPTWIKDSIDAVVRLASPMGEDHCVADKFAEAKNPSEANPK